MKDEKNVKTFPANTVIVKQGATGEGMYIIESGTAEISLELKNGDIIPLTNIGPGDIFGEMSFYCEGARSANVKALTELKVQVIGKNEVPIELEKTPFWFQEMFKKLIDKVRYSNLSIIHQTESKNELFERERLQAVIEVAGAAAHEINQPLTVIMASCELLKKKLDDEKINHYSEEIIKASQKISKIVSQMQIIHKYATKPYIGDLNILDFEESSKKVKK